MLIKVIEGAKAHVGKIFDLGFKGRTGSARDPQGRITTTIFTSDTVIELPKGLYDPVLIESQIINVVHPATGKSYVSSRRSETRLELRPIWTNDTRSIIKLPKVEIL